ncbi:tyrosine-protein phosphatase [Spirillospora albida]|uniref:tyrosine-protein phosphatase n=1 Tax=Spirillospora albida TaxID=58123 RepID=UPI0004C09483|nr:tyrosine-protein phosphatase [Spirillospora albida]
MRFDDEHGHIALDGAENVRDLGAVTGAIAPGRLLRADALGRLSDGDLARLAAVRTVVDFRRPNEIEMHGPSRLPAGAALVSLPVGAGSLQVFYDVVGSGDPARQQEVFGGGRIERALLDINRDFVREPRERERFAAALRLMADADRLPLVFHCTAGKDRTGWMAAIVLMLAGVSRADVMDDYLRSNHYHREGYGRLLDYLKESGRMEDPELLRPLLEQRPAYLEAAFDEAERRYGTFEGYVEKGLDVDGPTVERLLAALR